MGEPHVTLDPNSLNPVEERLREPLQEELSSALQVATERVEEHYDGQPVDEVCRMIEAETKRGLHPDIAAGFHPDHAELRLLAEVIISRKTGGTAPGDAAPGKAAPGNAT
jgi:hypothetical protein